MNFKSEGSISFAHQDGKTIHARHVSSDHRTAEITHFLNKWVLTCKAVLHKDLKIGHIEMDHSWAIMHSTCLAFNRLSISLYLTQCWEIVNNKTTIKSDIPIIYYEYISPNGHT